MKFAANYDFGRHGKWTWVAARKRYVRSDGKRFRTKEEMKRCELYALEAAR